MPGALGGPLLTDDGAGGTSGGDAASELGLVTFFQPFYNLRTDRLQGVEALARRRNAADGGTDLPAGFFAEASGAGVMRAIDERVLDEALGHFARWRASGAARELTLSINLSWDLVGHRAFVPSIIDALYRHRVPGDRLLVDLSTEVFRRLQAAGGETLGQLARLQKREISFCLDGFTARDLDILPAAVAAPVDIIKLHPRQVANDPADTGEALSHIAAAVQDVGLPVVAAGVETREQLDLVRELGFEWAQGFLLGRPVEASQALDHPAVLTLR